MRLELFHNPLLALERLGQWAIERRRCGRLRGTCAAELNVDYIDTLELLELLSARPPKVIYDLGANTGTWTLLARALFPGAEIHAFEPLDQHFNAFKIRTRSLQDIHLHNIALGAARESGRLRVTNFSDASSLLPLTDKGRREWDLKQVDEVQVEVYSLDDWIVEHGLPWPDLMKLDVQGLELEVLRGAERALSQTRAVLTEVSFHEYYAGQCLFEEILSVLAHQQFRLFAFGHGTPLARPLSQADVLFCKDP